MFVLLLCVVEETKTQICMKHFNILMGNLKTIHFLVKNTIFDHYIKLDLLISTFPTQLDYHDNYYDVNWNLWMR